MGFSPELIQPNRSLEMAPNGVLISAQPMLGQGQQACPREQHGFIFELDVEEILCSRASFGSKRGVEPCACVWCACISERGAGLYPCLCTGWGSRYAAVLSLSHVIWLRHVINKNWLLVGIHINILPPSALLTAAVLSSQLLNYPAHPPSQP